MTEADPSTSWRRFAGPIASVVVALVWVGLASRRPGAHYHFAPLLVTVAWTYGRRWSVRRPLSRTETGTSIAGGALVAAGTALGLAATNRLEGVTFWHSDTVLVEVALVVGLGAVWSAWIGLRPEPQRPEPAAGDAEPAIGRLDASVGTVDDAGRDD